MNIKHFHHPIAVYIRKNISTCYKDAGLGWVVITSGSIGKSKEQPNWSEEGVRKSVVKEDGDYSFVEVFLIVSLIFDENVKKYFGQ
jgi:hypothetical protein